MSKKEFITILAITLIVALVWVISDLTHTRSGSKDLPDAKGQLEPLEPGFDQQTLERVSTLSTPAPAPSAGPLGSALPAVTPRPVPSASIRTFTPQPFPTAIP